MQADIQALFTQVESLQETTMKLIGEHEDYRANAERVIGIQERQIEALKAEVSALTEGGRHAG